MTGRLARLVRVGLRLRLRLRRRLRLRLRRRRRRRRRRRLRLDVTVYRVLDDLAQRRSRTEAHDAAAVLIRGGARFRGRGRVP